MDRQREIIGTSFCRQVVSLRSVTYHNYTPTIPISLSSSPVVSTIVFSFHFSHFPTVEYVTRELSFLSMTSVCVGDDGTIFKRQKCTKSAVNNLLSLLVLITLQRMFYFCRNMLNCTKRTKKKLRIDHWRLLLPLFFYLQYFGNLTP